MSAKPESQAAPHGHVAPLSGDHEAPSSDRALSDDRSTGASGRLPKERGQTPSPFVSACGALAAAAAATFVICGVWQAWALIGRAQDLAHDPITTRQTPVPASATAPPAAASATLSQPVSPELAAPPPPRRPAGANGKHDDQAAAREAPLLTASGALSLQKTTAGVFEALAEASEKSTPVGLDAVLDDTAGALTLGQPPPATYPRVDCEDIFVYIVTIAEGAPLRSSASIGVGRKGPARVRRPGQDVAGWTVLAISDDWSGLNPRVWLDKDGAACRAELAGNPSRVHQTPKPPPRVKARRRRPRRR